MNIYCILYYFPLLSNLSHPHFQWVKTILWPPSQQILKTLLNFSLLLKGYALCSSLKSFRFLYNHVGEFLFLINIFHGFSSPYNTELPPSHPWIKSHCKQNEMYKILWVCCVQMLSHFPTLNHLLFAIFGSFGTPNRTKQWGVAAQVVCCILWPPRICSGVCCRF